MPPSAPWASALKNHASSGHHREARRTMAQQLEALRGNGRAVLDADHGLELRKLKQGLVREVDPRAIGNVVERDRLRRMLGERSEMQPQALLGGTRVVG